MYLESKFYCNQYMRTRVYYNNNGNNIYKKYYAAVIDTVCQ